MFNKKLQILFSLGALFIFLVGFSWYNYSVYHELKKLVYNKVDQQLLSAAKGINLVLENDFHERAKDPGSISALEDANNIIKLSEFAKISGVEYVYTMIQKGDKVFFTSSSATQEEIATGNLLTRYYDEYDDFDPDIKRVFLEQKVLYSENTDIWGTHRAVGVPYVTSDGRKYVAGADIEIDLFQAMIQEVTAKNIFFGLVLLLSGLPMLIWNFKKSKTALMSLVEHDPLTKLFNRRGLSERLPKAIASCNKRDNYGAILFIDLDHFKHVNDSKGHTIGDIVLTEVARRLKDSTHMEDTLARFGGDEFVILIEDIGDDEEDGITNVTKIAKNILSSLSMPYEINENKFSITGSIGISLFTANTDPDDLLRYADTAMYTAKDAGRNTMKFFDSDIQRRVEENTILFSRLQKAFEEDQKSLFCHYQIQVDKHENIIGLESLIRWVDPILGNVPPEVFIPIAEKNDLIFKLGSFILLEAAQKLSECKSDPLRKSWHISVNISAKQLEQEGFVDFMKKLISKYNIEPDKLKLELTESVLITNAQKALSRIQELASMGLKFSLDDFGTGYSSLSYFKQLPIDELKIDKSFVKDIVEVMNDKNIVQTIITFGQLLELNVIAEGVETREQYETLISLGCKYFQGYYFGRPTDFQSLL
jgi:diguanylate cyclase (GGDEF)-like protein